MNSVTEAIQTIFRIKRNPFVKTRYEDNEILNIYFVLNENKIVNEAIKNENDYKKIYTIKISEINKHDLKLKSFNLKKIEVLGSDDELVKIRIEKSIFKFLDENKNEIKSIDLKAKNTIDIWRENQEIRVEKEIKNVLDLYYYFDNYINVDYKNILEDTLQKYSNDKKIVI